MCTFTAIKIPDSELFPGGMIRIAFNRDELRKRPIAKIPIIGENDDVRYMYPVDPQGGGTWIGVNDFGIAMALLNFNPEPGSPLIDKIKTLLPGAKSRGTIIPVLLVHKNMQEVLNHLDSFSVGRFLPFRLIVLDSNNVASLTWNGETFDRHISPWNKEPFFFTSSGLSDELVERIRRPIFQKMFAEPLHTKNTLFDPLRIQDEFHAYHDPGRPHVSICMERNDAKTVSYSVIEISSKTIRLAYKNSPPCRPGKIIRNDFDRRSGSQPV